MHHVLDLSEENIAFLRENIFPKIRDNKTILFLGAGASVTTHSFLGSSIIDYYQDKLGIDLGISDLVEFMDVVESHPSFNRVEFDQYVDKNLLRKLKPGDTHQTIVTTPWRMIVTTNYDLLLEKSFDNIRGTHKELYEIKPIRERNEYSGVFGPDVIKYVKLNGCISDKSRYPLVFSSQDFERSNKLK